MSALYKNKYRSESARAQWWDYGSEGAYFITICTAGRHCFFGDIPDQKMHLSAIGDIVEQEWKKTPEIRPDMNLTLDAWIVMPNHFHAILSIGQNEFNRTQGGTDTMCPDGRDAMHRVPTTENDTALNSFRPQSKNLASVIRGFKSAVTIQARRINPDFGWQSRFHDHIIRNADAHQRIRQYIIDNPRKWDSDKLNRNA